MELATFSIPKTSQKFVLAPIGDIQWSGDAGPTAQDTLKRHIDRCLEQDAFFFGVGDYIDFLSPSNRAKLMAAELYDTAQDVIAEKALELVEQVYEKFLKPTTGRWVGMVEGHHFFQGGGRTTDELLAEQLKTKFLGTSAFVRINNARFTIYAHHGTGAGQLPGTGLNRLYHTAAGLEGADVYLMGHNTKVATTRLSRPYPVWDRRVAGWSLFSQMQYIDMDFEEALQAKWDAGLKKHRKYGEAGFRGDPSEELFQELLDAIHYVVQLESSGVELPGYRTTLKNMALALQQRRRELKRRT